MTTDDFRCVVTFNFGLADHQGGKTLDSETARRRAERGALFLDEHRPGWAQKIRLGELDLRSNRKCVLGQLFGTFHDGLSAYRHLGLNPKKLGFTLSRDYFRESWQPLTLAWRDEVERRQKQQQQNEPAPAQEPERERELVAVS